MLASIVPAGVRPSLVPRQSWLTTNSRYRPGYTRAEFAEETEVPAAVVAQADAQCAEEARIGSKPSIVHDPPLAVAAGWTAVIRPEPPGITPLPAR